MPSAIDKITKFTLISVVIPIYNEENNIKPLYEKTIAVLKTLEVPWEIIFINDGSTDNSTKNLENIEKNDAHVKVVNFTRNFGQTAAMMAGLDYAQGDVIVPMDGDLQNDPEDIPNLLAKLCDGYDVVSGWRKDRKDHPIKRNFVSRVANALISKISGVQLHDYGCSLKAYRKWVTKDIKLYGEMHRFIPIYASWQGAMITEIPVKHHARIHGQSKYGLERILKVLLDLIVVKFLAKYAQKPMHLFGMMGILSLIIAFSSGIYAIYLKLFNDISFVATPLPLLVVLTTITSIMFIMMGLLAELVMRTYYESQGKNVYLVKENKNIDTTH